MVEAGLERTGRLRWVGGGLFDVVCGMRSGFFVACERVPEIPRFRLHGVAGIRNKMPNDSFPTSALFLSS